MESQPRGQTACQNATNEQRHRLYIVSINIINKYLDPGTSSLLQIGSHIFNIDQDSTEEFKTSKQQLKWL
jgi:hypothetical protein